MPNVVSCPSCQKQLKVPDALIGKSVKCPGCQETFTAKSAPNEEIAEKPRKKAAPSPEEDDYETPREATRRDDYDSDGQDGGAEDRPSRRRSGRSMEPRRGVITKPGKVQTISYMVLAGGIFAIAWFLVECFLSIFFCFCFIPGIYSLVIGILTTIKGVQLMGDDAYRQPIPRTAAVLLIVNAVNFDVVGVTLGILILVFSNEREVQDYFQG
jgi:hypothetical protein